MTLPFDQYSIKGGNNKKAFFVLKLIYDVTETGFEDQIRIDG